MKEITLNEQQIEFLKYRLVTDLESVDSTSSAIIKQILAKLED